MSILYRGLAYRPYKFVRSVVSTTWHHLQVSRTHSGGWALEHSTVGYRRDGRSSVKTRQGPKQESMTRTRRFARYTDSMAWPAELRAPFDERNP